MFGTIILDAYEESSKKDLAKSIEEICSPMDSYGWASAGIYSFWDYYSNEVLYIGLAADLPERFKQHNGILPLDDASCKWADIQTYFHNNKKLGYSVLVQSPLSQPATHRNQEQYRKFLEIPKGSPINDYAGEDGKENIRRAEGQLIRAFKLATKKLPKWNKIEGDVWGRRKATVNNYNQIIRHFATVDTTNILVSRSSISELANNATYTAIESDLHALRMMILTMGMTYEDAIHTQLLFNPYFKASWNRILESGYLNKSLNL